MPVRINTPRTLMIRGLGPPRSLAPAEAADEGDELGAAAVLDLHAGADAGDARQALVAGRTDRDDQSSGAGQLLHERLGNRGSGRGHDDPVERSLIGPAVGAVEDLDRG